MNFHSTLQSSGVVINAWPAPPFGSIPAAPSPGFAKPRLPGGAFSAPLAILLMAGRPGPACILPSARGLRAPNQPIGQQILRPVVA